MAQRRVYQCHHDLYENFPSVGNILDPEFQIEEAFRNVMFWFCNPCDVKIKTNRFQQFGHTSVEIKFRMVNIFHVTVFQIWFISLSRRSQGYQFLSPYFIDYFGDEPLLVEI